MKLALRLFIGLALILGSWTVAPQPATAQSITTGGITGQVFAADGRAALPGAQVVAVHEPTGTRYDVITRGDGRFTIPNARVGGPYVVTVSMDGFRDQQATGINVALGQSADLEFELQLAAIEEVVTVTGESSTIINSSRTGAESNVAEEAIETLPTIDRNLTDFARTNPFFTVIPDNGDEGQLSVAGRNNRYNNISIDGAVNNDLFGLSDTGAPAGQTLSTPISLDAIQELQLQVAPMDVRYGGFTGGSINAITRSGTNQLAGSVFYFDRDDSLVGDRDDFRNPEFGTFEAEQYGFRLGGPIAQDRVFFFINGEVDELNEPSGFSIGGSSGIEFGSIPEAQRFRDILINQYGFDPGSTEEQTVTQDSDKAFGRLDFNLADAHQLTVRHNFIDSGKEFLNPSGSTFDFPSHAHQIQNETNSTVAQLNSVFGSAFFNEARVTLQKVEDRRNGLGQPFPYVNVELPNGDNFEAGTERFSTANALDQDILEISDDLTWLRGAHTITLGTRNELFEFRNLFIRENFGAYRFDSLDDLAAGNARQFDYSFSVTGDPQQAATFDSRLLSFYGSDEWAARDNLTLTFGVRVDVPQFPDDPSRNPATEELFGLRTDVTPDNKEIISPRFGFNWDPRGEGRQQVRGGVGKFSGRAPFVWLSNQYSNTGIEFGRIRVFDQPFNPDPFNQPTQVGDTLTSEVDMIDPDFELPQIWRANLAYDRELGFLGLTGTVEVIYAETDKDIAYQNLLIVPDGGTAFDGRPTFQKILTDRFTDAIFLTNTSEGEQTSAAVKVERPYRDGWYGFVSYLYNDAKGINDGDSSQARSNWRFNETPGDPNNLPLSTSDYEVEDNITAALSYQFDVAEGWPTTVGLFYNAQSGRPYSSTFSFSFPTINGDREGNDLMYVPASADEVIITNGTWEQLDNYINLDDGLRANRGRIVPRNASSSPWNHSLDLRLAQGFSIGRNTFEVTVDVLNLANIIDEESGTWRYVPFSGIDPVRYEGIDEATGKAIYTLRGEVFDPDSRWSIDDLRSRWRAKLGLRWTF